MSKKVHIFFNHNTQLPEDEKYFIFPKTAIEPLESSYTLPFEMYPDWLARLKESLRSELTKVSANKPILDWSINNLFFWRYLHLFRAISVIKKEIIKKSIKEIEVHGSVNSAYKIVTNKGDESRALFYRPELEIPDYLQQALEADCQLNFDKNQFKSSLGKLEHLLRAYIIFFLKWGLLFFIKVIRYIKPARVCPPQSAQVVFVARSLGAAEQFRRYSNKLLIQGIRSAILLDLNLQQAFRVSPQELYYDGEDLVSFWDIFTLGFQQLLQSLKSSKLSVRLDNGEFQLVDDVGAYVRELDLASIDLKVHELRLKRFFEKMGAEVIANGEGISPYIFLYDQLAKKMGLRCLKIQTILLSINDAVDFCISDGFIVESQQFNLELQQRFPESSRRVHYLGDFDFISQPKKKSLDALVKIVYFSQFHDLENSRDLIRAMIGLAAQSTKKIKLCVKPHPRDPLDYSVFPELEVFSKDCSVDECMQLATIAIGRSSSVLNRALLFGVPYIVCQLSDADRYVYAPFMDSQLDVVVSTVDEFEKRLQNLSHFIDQYYINRSLFVRDNFKEFDLEKFIEILNLKSQSELFNAPEERS